MHLSSKGHYFDGKIQEYFLIFKFTFLSISPKTERSLRFRCSKLFWRENFCWNFVEYIYKIEYSYNWFLFIRIAIVAGTLFWFALPLWLRHLPEFLGQSKSKKPVASAQSSESSTQTTETSESEQVVETSAESNEASSE